MRRGIGVVIHGKTLTLGVPSAIISTMWIFVDLHAMHKEATPC